MKTFKKLLIALCVLAVAVSVFAVCSFADDETYTGSVEAAQTFVDAYADADDKAKAIATIHAYLPTVDPEAEGYDELMKSVTAVDVAYTELLYANATQDFSGTPFPHIYANIAARTLVSFVNDYPLDEEHAELAAQVAAVKADYEERLAADKEALYSQATLTDYVTYPTAQYDVDFQGELPGTEFPASMSKNLTGASMPNKGSPNPHWYGVKESADGNRYWALVYNQLNDSEAHNYLQWRWTSNTPVVVEWDFSTETTFASSMGPQSALDHNGGRAFPTWFTISGGNFNGDGTVIENTIQKNQWTHFICTIDLSGNLTVYIDYIKIGTWSSNGSTKYLESDYIINNLRIGNMKADPNHSSFSIDNFRVYNGISPRQYDFLAKLTENREAALVYYASIASDESNAFNDRFLAINRANAYIDDYYDRVEGQFLDGVSDEVKAASSTLLAIDTTEIEAAVKAANLSTYKTLVEALGALSAEGTRTVGNIAAREVALQNVDAFTANNMLDTLSSEYRDLYNRYATYGTQIDQDKAARKFITEMETFDRHFTFSSMQRHYAAGAEAYAAMDPAVVFAVKSENDQFVKAKNVYAGAPEVLAEATRQNNSKKIVSSMNRISVYTTEEEWEEHYDMINPFVVAIRSIIKEGNYEQDFDGMDRAMIIFGNVNGYFYNKLQQVHIAEISDRIDAFHATSSYIERLGAVSYIERYLETNDIDPNNTELQKLITAYGVLKEELGVQKDEYDVLLTQNTQRFINTMTIVRAYSDYATLKNYFDKATSYYFSMNVADGMDALVEEYTAISNRLKAIEEASEKFLGAYEQLDAAETADETYLALVACHKVYDLADASFEGVAEAKAAYESALAAYNAEISPVNAEFAIATDAMCAVRAICNLKGVMTLLRSVLY